jgi:hypothetical protein
MCFKTLDLIWSIWEFYRSKGFEAMKAEKLAIWTWLSCQVTKNTLMDNHGQSHKKTDLFLIVFFEESDSWLRAELFWLFLFVFSIFVIIQQRKVAFAYRFSWFVKRFDAYCKSRNGVYLFPFRKVGFIIK